MTYLTKLYSGEKLYKKLTSVYNLIVHSKSPQFTLLALGFYFRLTCFFRGDKHSEQSI